MYLYSTYEINRYYPSMYSQGTSQDELGAQIQHDMISSRFFMNGRKLAQQVHSQYHGLSM